MNSSLTMPIRVKDLIEALDRNGYQYEINDVDNSEAKKFPKYGIEIKVKSKTHDYTFVYVARTPKKYQQNDIDERMLHFDHLLDQWNQKHNDRHAFSEHKWFFRTIGLS